MQSCADWNALKCMLFLRQGMQQIADLSATCCIPWKRGEPSPVRLSAVLARWSSYCYVVDGIYFNKNTIKDCASRTRKTQNRLIDLPAAMPFRVIETKQGSVFAMLAESHHSALSSLRSLRLVLSYQMRLKSPCRGVLSACDGLQREGLWVGFRFGAFFINLGKRSASGRRQNARKRLPLVNC